MLNIDSPIKDSYNGNRTADLWKGIGFLESFCCKKLGTFWQFFFFYKQLCTFDNWFSNLIKKMLKSKFYIGYHVYILQMKMIRNLCHKETGGNLYFTFGNSQFLFYFHRFISKKKNITILFSFKLWRHYMECFGNSK